MEEIKRIQDSLSPLQEELRTHKLYKNINSLEKIHLFMQTHVFAVWDFMSIAKSLQLELTGINVPWVPNEKTKVSRRLINDIVLAEETDIDEKGDTKSHFELYTESMNQAGACTKQIELLVELVKEKKDIFVAIDSLELEDELKDFLYFTFQTIESKQMHKIAALLTFARENLIPTMFIELVKEFNDNSDEQISKFVYYVNRHIDIDGHEHGPMSLTMMQELCEDDEQKWLEVEETSIKALELRVKLWDCIYNQF